MLYHFTYLFITICIFYLPKSVIPLDDTTENVNDEVQDNSSQSRSILNNVIKDASPCECLENSCSCNFNFISENPGDVNSGTVSIKYDTDNGVLMALRVGDEENHLVIKDITSGVEFPPICTRVPRVPLVKFCAVLYDVRLNQDFGLHTCVSIESQAITTTISAVSFDCINLSANKINTVAPDQHRPSLVEIHVGKTPKITFFNSVSVGVLPSLGIPQIIEEPMDTLKTTMPMPIDE